MQQTMQTIGTQAAHAPTISVNDGPVWFLTGIGLLLIALLFYVLIYLRDLNEFRAIRSIPKRLAYLIAHSPNDRRPAWPHMIAGVCLFLGICLLAGLGLSALPYVNRPERGIFIAVSEFCFGILLALITFWTLWQTKRIEQLQGETIGDFKELMISITSEIDELIEEVRESKGHSRPHHRILFATTNPYFGLLSYGKIGITNKFHDALMHAADLMKETHGQPQYNDPNRLPFILEVLCADASGIKAFNAKYYTAREGSVTGADNDTETFITELNDHSAKDVCARTLEGPATEFIIVGNVVFDFILQPTKHGSQIYKGMKYREKVICDRYGETFKLLKALYNSQATLKAENFRGQQESPGSNVTPITPKPGVAG